MLDEGLRRKFFPHLFLDVIPSMWVLEIVGFIF